MSIFWEMTSYTEEHQETRRFSTGLQNKEIFKFPFANEVALEECHKRGIDVYLGWELIEVKTNEAKEKIGVFKCVDTGKVIEKEFAGMSCNPPHKPQKEVLESGLADSNGLLP